MWPSRVSYQVGISIYLYEAQYPARQCPCLRFDGRLAVTAARGQDGSLLLSYRALSSPATCRFIPAHNPLILLWCGRWDSNPHGPCGPAAFKAAMSTGSITSAVVLILHRDFIFPV